MDDKRFDTISRALAAGGSRRRVLGILAGGVAALAGAATLEAKRGGKGKGKAKGRGRGNGGNGNGNGNGNGDENGGGGQEKVLICHRNNGKKGFTLIEVGAPAVPAHERHGDVVCETDRACAVVTGCDDDGACIFRQADEGAACEVDGMTGACDANAVCVVDDGGAEG